MSLEIVVVVVWIFNINVVERWIIKNTEVDIGGAVIGEVIDVGGASEGIINGAARGIIDTESTLGTNSGALGFSVWSHQEL
ncbi:hypothetical protein HAX54_046602 [Datura stramonium]|uniref:Uncharacterized protein n=1 Tax=Datura stramonium TaxID=4076 RepID=A0ABS8WJF6_DATST|nr:hypothetical protein [Datura stramonium]